MLNKIKQNEDGITLIELLAAVTISAIIGLIGISILLTGYKTQNRVEAEAELRDQADLIMASMLNELYSLKVSEVRPQFPEAGTSNYYLEITNKEAASTSRTGFINGKAIINDKEIMLTDDSTALMNGTKISELVTDESNLGDPNLSDNPIEITLVLSKDDSGQQIETKSVIQLIDDISTEQ
ncbi:prepilin-type N-terminal cleavage/methylation domain-containing protein [Oceanobacillus chungangensis]|uniref:Prepilin-type cleavage/methylation domain-containing protein n=1 Tax=Oceanobacillus chungangensis TaxID=1229152 RepID=A0A3D8Q1W9_9BACI|nr:prepilin-type N-terminal cleavage/methylation domain-containing protein [Oceanobacillus chungangensis]RDW21571.1 hypothetical protein CWR45_01470 [Oceanobacillus chungangensis]